RHPNAFSLLAYLARDLSLPDGEALDWVELWDAGNRPSLGREELEEILADVHKYGHHPYGYGLRGRCEGTDGAAIAGDLAAQAAAADRDAAAYEQLEQRRRQRDLRRRLVEDTSERRAEREARPRALEGASQVWGELQGRIGELWAARPER